MSCLITVGGSEAYFDILARIRHEVHTHGGPLFPCDVLIGFRDMPSAQVSFFHRVRIRIIGMSARLADEFSVFIQDLQPEERFTDTIMTGILYYGSIFDNQDTLVLRIHGEGIRNCLRLSGLFPVAQSHGSQSSRRNGKQFIIRTRIRLCRVGMDGMTTLFRIGTEINPSNMGIGIFAGMSS